MQGEKEDKRSNGYELINKIVIAIVIIVLATALMATYRLRTVTDKTPELTINITSDKVLDAVVGVMNVEDTNIVGEVDSSDTTENYTNNNSNSQTTSGYSGKQKDIYYDYDDDEYGAFYIGGKKVEIKDSSSHLTVEDDDQTWETGTKINVFKAQYTDENGITSVMSSNDDKVVAPGTSNSYRIRLVNDGETSIKYTIKTTAYFSNDEYSIPVKVKFYDYDKNYIVGSDETYEDFQALDDKEDTKVLSSKCYYTYNIDWEWPYEQEDDEYDTLLGNLVLTDDLSLTIEIEIIARMSTEHGIGNPLTGERSDVLIIIIIVFALVMIMILISLLLKDNDKDKKHKKPVVWLKIKNRLSKIRLSTVFRIIVLPILSIFIGFSIYNINATSLTRNSMPKPFGYGLSVVMSGSMEPNLHVNDLAIIKDTALDELEVGDIIVYSSGNSLVIHRIIDINWEDEYVITQGDANNIADEPVSFDRIEGKCIFKIYGIGKLIIMLKKPQSTIVLIILALVLIELSYAKDKKQSEQSVEDLKAEIRKLKSDETNE